MDTIRLAPSSTAHGAHASRQKPTAGTSLELGAFSALLTGLQDPLVDLPTAVGSESLKAADSTAAAGWGEGSAAPEGVVAGVSTWSPSPELPKGTASELGLPDPSALVAGLGVFSQTSVAEDARAVGALDRQIGDAASGRVGDTPPLIGAAKPAIGPVTPGVTEGFAVKTRGTAVPLQAAMAGLSVVQGVALPGEQAAAERALAVASAGQLGPGALVAQTARMDDAKAHMLSDQNSEVVAHTPSHARRAAGIALSDKFRAAQLAPDQAARHAAKASASSRAGIATDPQAAPDSNQLLQGLQKAAEGAQASANQRGGVTELAPMVGVTGALSIEPRAGRTESIVQGRPDSFGGGLAAFTDVGHAPALDAGAAPADGLVASSEEAIAEQVTYWLSENLKNAELTVEHAGQPVEVRVSLAGNEAHVAFRSDQAHTRALLDAHMEDLRELLRGEGLVLSGTSVDSGASGQEGDNASKRPQEGTRAARVAAATDSHNQVVRRSSTNSAVDLYV